MMAGDAVVIDDPKDAFHGERGVLLQIHPRDLGVRIRLDRLPINCQSRDMWFAAHQYRQLPTGRPA